MGARRAGQTPARHGAPLPQRQGQGQQHPQALVDRFAPGQPNHGKGTKAEPGFFYGFRADVWQAFALAVYAADQLGDPLEKDAS